MSRFFLLVTLAFVLGIGTTEFLSTNFSFRRWLGQVVRRGELQELAGRRGIYENDVERAWRTELFARDAEAGEIAPATAAEQRRAVLERLIAEEKLKAAAASQALAPGVLKREINLLRWQFRDEKTWQTILQGAAISRWILRRTVADDLRARAWIEQHIAAQLAPIERESQRYFTAHQAEFQEPLRLRASHLFLAAPDGYPREVIDAQRGLIDLLSKRIANGESFPALVAEFSEDDATKKRAGDLGYFAEERMLPEVFDAAATLQPGQISAPVRSRLGFHLLRLTESRPARALTFEEAQPEIETRIANLKRARAVAALR